MARAEELVELVAGIIGDRDDGPLAGVPGMVVSPTAPGTALEADKAVAGSEVRYSADPAPSPSSSSSGGGGGASPAPAPDPSPDAPWHDPAAEENKDKKHYIEIELWDDEKNPVPGEQYEIILPDGSTVASGTTDEKGYARVDNIDPGQCRVRFPKRDQTVVKPR